MVIHRTSIFELAFCNIFLTTLLGCFRHVIFLIARVLLCVLHSFGTGILMSISGNLYKLSILSAMLSFQSDGEREVRSVFVLLNYSDCSLKPCRSRRYTLKLQLLPGSQSLLAHTSHPFQIQMLSVFCDRDRWELSQHSVLAAHKIYGKVSTVRKILMKFCILY